MRPGPVPRLELRIERLRTTYRFTYAFHAREVRFERDRGEGAEPLFPEVFSFHADRHDPAELYLRLEDLWTNPVRLGAGASRRDAEELVLRLLSALPWNLATVLDRLEGGESRDAFLRACEDVAVFGQVVGRFLGDKGLAEHPRLALAEPHLRKLVLRALRALVEARVGAEALAAYVAGELEPDRSTDAWDTGFFYALASGEGERVERALLGAAEAAFFRWVEEVCLDPERRVFESERSPFEDREREVCAAIAAAPGRPIVRGRDLSPFLRRPASRDALRLLSRLETFFLRQYDVPHAAAVLHHAEHLRAGRDDADRVLTRHGTRNYLLTLGVPALPFLAAIFAYERARPVIDAIVTAEVIGVLVAAFWLLVVRFMWRKDLSFFHASVPRIGAGIIVGYLPVFVIDEVWDLAEQPPYYLLGVAVLLGATTLLYLFVEVQRRLGDRQEAFARARAIFLLGMIEAVGFGLVVTSLLGPLMATRNWGVHDGHPTLELVRETLPPFLGELPRIVGVAPFVAFPSAVLLMSFLAFFIGTFLQLLWEDLPITEPL